MSISSPSITTTISTSASAYVSEINDNFSDIQDFMDSVASEFNDDPPATQGFPLSSYYAGTLTAGAMNFGIIVPFFGEIVCAYARLNTCLTDTDANLTIQIRDGATNVFDPYTLSWSGGDGTTVQYVSMGGASLTEIDAGTFLQVYTIFDTYDWTNASGLALTILVRKKTTT